MADAVNCAVSVTYFDTFDGLPVTVIGMLVTVSVAWPVMEGVGFAEQVITQR